MLQFNTFGLRKLARELGTSVLDKKLLEPHLRKLVVDLTGIFSHFAAEKCRISRPGHKLSFGFLSDKSYNAIAAIEFDRQNNKEDILAINIGIVIILDRLFSSSMSHPLVLPLVGDPAMLSSASRKGRETPNCPIRAALANFLTKSTCLFVFQHELGHIWNGHVDLVNGLTGLRAISEAAPATSSGLSPIDLRTLEMDADAYGTANCLWQSANAFSSDLGLLISTAEGKIPRSPTNLTVPWLLALAGICLQFKLFEDKVHSQSELDSQSHPPSQQRSLACVAVGVTAMVQRFGFSQEHADETGYGAVALAEEINHLVRGESLDIELFKKDSVRFKQLNEELLRNWHNLYPRLDKLKRGGELPEPQQWVLDA